MVVAGEGSSALIGQRARARKAIEPSARSFEKALREILAIGEALGKAVPPGPARAPSEKGKKRKGRGD